VPDACDEEKKLDFMVILPVNMVISWVMSPQQK
jgi:hypothetical protein